MKNLVYFFFIAFLPYEFSCPVFAQQLIYDNSFPGHGGASGTVFSIVKENGGKFILGGSFSSYNALNSRGIVRIDSNGSIDASFNSGSGVSTRINKLRMLSDGRIYAGGTFASYNGTNINNLIRLMPNGNIDPSFATGSGPNNEILAIGVCEDSSIIVSGFFSQYQGQPVTQPIRIRPNGQRDTSFNPGGTGATFGTIIDAIVVQPDGKILLGGSFTLFNGQPASKIVRLNPDGSVDNNFNTGSGFSGGNISSIDLQPDGKIVAGGSFTSFNGAAATRIARLMPNGSRDTTFNTGTGMNSNVREVMSRADGSIVAAGDFSTFNGATVNRVAWLDNSGRIISAVSSCAGTNGTVYTISETGSQNLLIGGAFTQVAGQTTGRFAKLNTSSGASSLPAFSPVNTGICAGGSVLLQITSGNLNGADNWQWYKDSCGGTTVGSGTQLAISPSQSSTYYVRGEGACSGSGGCSSVSIIVSNENNWTGSVSDEWENPLNWSCNAIPGPNSIVHINAPSPNYPVIRSFATCYQIFVNSGASLVISPGFRLDLTGP